MLSLRVESAARVLIEGLNIIFPFIFISSILTVCYFSLSPSLSVSLSHLSTNYQNGSLLRVYNNRYYCWRSRGRTLPRAKRRRAATIPRTTDTDVRSYVPTGRPNY